MTELEFIESCTVLRARCRELSGLVEELESGRPAVTSIEILAWQTKLDTVTFCLGESNRSLGWVIEALGGG
jgi:hypothetical protein